MGQWPGANINVVMEEFYVMVAWEQTAQATVVNRGHATQSGSIL